MVTISPIIWIYFSLTLITITVFVLVLLKYLRDEHKNSKTHKLTRLLLVLSFFLFVDSLYHSFSNASQFGLISPNIFFKLSEPGTEFLPKLGIFISTVLLVHFVLDNGIEEFKKNELGFNKLQKLNHELETKAVELQHSQNTLQKKVIELEKFNDIAKQRESKMLDLIKKIEALEKQLKNK